MDRLPPLDAKVERIVCAAGMDGITARLVAEQIERGESTTGGRLRQLADAGRIECTHPKGGRANRWGPPGIAAHWAAVVEAGWQSRRKYVAKARAGREAMAKFEAPIVQRIVPAAEAPPLRVRGPASVWDLARDAA